MMEKSDLFVKLEKKYMDFLRDLSCIVCYINGIHSREGEVHVHHEALSKRFGGDKRATDFQGMPLCVFHHEERHKLGYEKFWIKYANISAPYLIIFTLWKMFFDSCFPKDIDLEQYLTGDGFDAILDMVMNCEAS